MRRVHTPCASTTPCISRITSVVLGNDDVANRYDAIRKDLRPDASQIDEHFSESCFLRKGRCSITRPGRLSATQFNLADSKLSPHQRVHVDPLSHNVSARLCRCEWRHAALDESHVCLVDSFARDQGHVTRSLSCNS